MLDAKIYYQTGFSVLASSLVSEVSVGAAVLVVVVAELAFELVVVDVVRLVDAAAPVLATAEDELLALLLLIVVFFAGFNENLFFSSLSPLLCLEM